MSVSDNVWTERYRPNTLDDIIGHDNIVNRMESFLDDPEMPNLLFAGPQGVGKTAMVQAFAKEKYGDNWRNNVIEMNASDERGINVVREKIKKHAVSGAVDSDFKIIFLDEADNLTTDAQPALRRIMEDYSDKTRFILSCNYPNQIIDPLQSRCAPIYFDRLAQSDIKRLIIRVLSGEGIDYDESTVEELAKEARGDGRKAITLIQVAVDKDENVLRDDWADVMVSIVDHKLVEDIIDMTVKGDIGEAMTTLDKEIIKQGIDHQTICDEFLKQVKRYNDIPNDARAKIIDKIAECDYRIMYGANPNVQFHSLLTDIHGTIHISYYDDSE